MKKRVLIISSSPNKNGNSDLLAEQFRKGAEDAGNIVNKIFLADKEVGYCKACQYCKGLGHGKCAINDDMSYILKNMHDADVIVLATPVYFYGICAQIKTVIDRTYACWTELTNKELYYLISCAANSYACVDAAVEQFHGWEICLTNPKRCGVIYGTSVASPGEIRNKPSYEKAYEMGKNI